jgi:hypothetical protein
MLLQVASRYPTNIIAELLNNYYIFECSRVALLKKVFNLTLEFIVTTRG